MWSHLDSSVNYLEADGLIWKHWPQVQSPRIIQNHQEIFAAILKYLGSCEKTHLEASGAIFSSWNHLVSPLSFRVIWKLLGASGTIWRHLEPSSSIWNHLESFKAILSHLDSYAGSGIIQRHGESSAGNQEIYRRQPTDNQEVSRDTQEAPWGHPGGTQETPRRHSGSTKGCRGLLKPDLI